MTWNNHCAESAAWGGVGVCELKQVLRRVSLMAHALSCHIVGFCPAQRVQILLRTL